VNSGRVNAQEADDGDWQLIVDNFLLARNMGDYDGAASWCAPLLELQDIEEDWFVDQAVTADWLRQLTQQYLIDTIEHAHVEGKAVTWTERLTRRGAALPEAVPARMTVVVHAVIREGRTAYLSGPYPALPLRNVPAAPGQPTYVTDSNMTRGVPPAVLFTGCAVGLALLAVPVAAIGRVKGRGRPR
jgi:hypothetical protein